ncbi:MAG: hypothetical protein CTY12_00590 [Methylotenera sp.]|nr:MAG: hypothetical protein CTY12_00590 [Methylotenera sp.]
MRTIEKQRNEFKAGKLAGTIAADMTFKAYQAQIVELAKQAETVTTETVVAKVEVALKSSKLKSLKLVKLVKCSKQRWLKRLQTALKWFVKI